MAPLSKLEIAVSDRDQTCVEIEVIELRLQQRNSLPITNSECHMLIRDATKHKDDLSNAHKRIMQTGPGDDEAITYKNDFMTILGRLNIVRSQLEEIKREFQVASPSSNNDVNSQPKSATPKVNLPTLNIPSFSGKFEEWIPFKNIYVAGIHNVDIDNVCKLQYLQSYLRDEAYNLIKNLAITNESYDTAWKVLCDRYDNKRELVYSDVRKLFNITNAKEGTVHKIQHLLDQTKECKSALSVHGEPTVDTMLVYMTVEKLDPDTKRQWALSLTDNSLPTFDELCSFLQKHIRGLQAFSMPAKSYNNHHHHHERKATHFSSAKPSSSQNSYKCVVNGCNQTHPLYKCSVFLALTVKERNDVAKSAKLCYNCLKPTSPAHRTDSCSASKCKVCSKKHNTLLHYPRENVQQQQPAITPPSNSSSSSKASHHIRHDDEGNSDILLSTAVALAKDSCGEMQQVRLILDNCSEAVLIREDCVQRLGLRRKYDRTIITGVGGSKCGTSKGRIEDLVLYSKVNNEYIQIDSAYILPHVTDDFPSRPCRRNYPHLSNISLSDPNYHTPGTIDILISAQYFNSILRPGKVEVNKPNSPSAINTLFGWVLGGVVEVKKVHSVRINHTRCTTDFILQRFWQIESMPGDEDYDSARNNKNPLTADEKFCEEHFSNNYSRDSNGRFCVKLPVKDNISNLKQNRVQAINRWKSVERRLANNPQYQIEYVNFMKEYFQLGHMHRVPRPEESELCYYLPHHFVVKPDSTTTKFRVVFDASAKTSSGYSLNDCLSVGATIQDDIFLYYQDFVITKWQSRPTLPKCFVSFV